jgi:hypothetical protein
MGTGKLGEKLLGIKRLLDADSTAFSDDQPYNIAGSISGFHPALAENLVRTSGPIRQLVTQDQISIHLGSGNGSWALIASLLGYKSYGIECNEYLLERANTIVERAIKEGLIEPNQRPQFAQGNFFSGFEETEYAVEAMRVANLKDRKIPELNINPYANLGIQLSDAAIIYCFPWGDERTCFSQFLAMNARDDVLIAMVEERNYRNHDEKEFRGLELVAKTPILLWSKPEFAARRREKLPSYQN